MNIKNKMNENVIISLLTDVPIPWTCEFGTLLEKNKINCLPSCCEQQRPSIIDCTCLSLAQSKECSCTRKYFLTLINPQSFNGEPFIKETFNLHLKTQQTYYCFKCDDLFGKGNLINFTGHLDHHPSIYVIEIWENKHLLPSLYFTSKPSVWICACSRQQKKTSEFCTNCQTYRSIYRQCSCGFWKVVNGARNLLSLTKCTNGCPLTNKPIFYQINERIQDMDVTFITNETILNLGTYCNLCQKFTCNHDSNDKIPYSSICLPPNRIYNQAQMRIHLMEIFSQSEQEKKKENVFPHESPLVSSHIIIPPPQQTSAHIENYFPSVSNRKTILSRFNESTSLYGSGCSKADRVYIDNMIYNFLDSEAEEQTDLRKEKEKEKEKEEKKLLTPIDEKESLNYVKHQLLPWFCGNCHALNSRYEEPYKWKQPQGMIRYTCFICQKKISKIHERDEGYWDCTACTFVNRLPSVFHFCFYQCSNCLTKNDLISIYYKNGEEIDILTEKYWLEAQNIIIQTEKNVINAEKRLKKRQEKIRKELNELQTVDTRNFFFNSEHLNTLKSCLKNEEIKRTQNTILSLNNHIKENEMKKNESFLSSSSSSCTSPSTSFLINSNLIRTDEKDKKYFQLCVNQLNSDKIIEIMKEMTRENKTLNKFILWFLLHKILLRKNFSPFLISRTFDIFWEALATWCICYYDSLSLWLQVASDPEMNFSFSWSIWFCLGLYVAKTIPKEMQYIDGVIDDFLAKKLWNVLESVYNTKKNSQRL